MSGDQGDQYRNAIGALADEAKMPPASVARLERELLDAFAEHYGGVTPRAGWRRGDWRQWVAVAALIAIAASIGAWRFHSDVTVTTVPDGATPQQLPVAAHDSASMTPQALAPTVSPISIPAPHTPAARKAGPGRETVKPVGFVELPNAAGLPEFESGTIVRLELPAASLPAYGIEMPGAADERPVEADLLVGQDGLTRAIRLVAKSSDATGARDSHSKQE